MNNNIEPIYVNYDFAKFLKEKGFEEHSDYNQWILAKDVDSKDESKKFICHSNDLEEYTYINEEKEHNVYHCLTIPEHWQVIEWLRLNHGIWIHVYYLTEEQAWGWDCYRYKKENGLLNKPAISFSMKLQSPKESYSAAFDYIKNNNLI
jgi:hypothetical protein